MRVPCPACGGSGEVLKHLDGPQCISSWPKEPCKCCFGSGVQETCCKHDQVRQTPPALTESLMTVGGVPSDQLFFTASGA